MYIQRRIILFLLFLVTVNSSIMLNAQSPGGVSNEHTLWLKANQGVTLNNQLVQEWEEVSGANITGNFELISPGAGGLAQTAPGFDEAGINFNPYIVFNANQTNSISSGNSFAGNLLFTHNNVTVFQVINLKTVSGTGVWIKWQTTNTANNRLGNEVNNGGVNTGRQRFDLRGVNLYTSLPITNNHQIITNYTRPNSLGVRLQGANDNTINTYSTPTNTQLARLTIGNENVAGGDPYPTTVDMAELIIYKRDLSFEEMNKVESYLAIKYGFTLVQTGVDAVNYVASNDQVIWNNALNAPYVQRITGVGRDDASELHQKQSKSIHDDHLITLIAGNMTQTPVPSTNQANQLSISQDLNFVLIGDNGEITELTECVEAGGAIRMKRIWKTQATGSMESVTIGIEGNSDPMISHLLISDHEDFSQNISFIPFITNGDLKVAEYELAKGQYFTLSTSPIDLNEEIVHLICEGDRGSIELNPTGGIPPYSYLWHHDNSTNSSINNLLEDDYTVTITYGQGCEYTETLTVENELSIFTFDGIVSTAYCNHPNGSINIHVNGGTSPFTYQLDNNVAQDDAYFNNLTASTYTIKVTDNNNCSHEQEVIVPNTDYSLILEAEGSPSFCDLGGLGGKVEVEVSHPMNPPFNYYWQDFPHHNDPVVENIGAGEYEVVVKDNNGCEGTTLIKVEEIACCYVIFPNAFSPNGDGINDYFGAIANESMITFQMNIYNRWGQLVYTTSKPDGHWDGTLNLQDAPIGVYYYYGHYTCLATYEEISFKGEITLLR